MRDHVWGSVYLSDVRDSARALQILSDLHRSLPPYDGMPIVPAGQRDRLILEKQDLKRFDRTGQLVKLSHAGMRTLMDASWWSCSLSFEPAPSEDTCAMIMLSCVVREPTPEALEGAWRFLAFVLRHLCTVAAPRFAALNGRSEETDLYGLPDEGEVTTDAWPPLFTPLAFVGSGLATPEVRAAIARLPVHATADVDRGVWVEVVASLDDAPSADVIKAIEALDPSGRMRYAQVT